MTHSTHNTAWVGDDEETSGTASFPYWEGPGARHHRCVGYRQAVALLAAEMTGAEPRLVADTLIHPLVDTAESYLAAALAELAEQLHRLTGDDVPGLELATDAQVPSREQLPELWAAVSQAAAVVRPHTTGDQASEAAREAIEFLLNVHGERSVDAAEVATAVEVAAVFLEGEATGAHEAADAQAEAAAYNADMREQY